MLGKMRWLSLLAVLSLTTLGVGTVASADASTEDMFLSQINASRAAVGKPPLAVDSSLRSYARTHSQFMADGNCPPKADGSPATICHSTSAQLQAAAGHGWSALGENVGRGGASTLHESFMKSSGHRDNILGDYNYVGIGTVYANESTYVTVVFMKKGTSSGGGTASTTTTKPKAESPKPTTTTSPTTTVPPTTTTTLVVGPDKPVTPGGSCLAVTRFWWVCHD
jgi:hypothetical protein